MIQVFKIDLPDFQEELSLDPEKLTPEEIRSKMKEKGLQPYRPWQEAQIELSSTGDIFEPYVPPEGDGKASIISTDVIPVLNLFLSCFLNFFPF